MYTQRRPLDSDGRGVRRHTAILAGIDHKNGWAFLFSAWAVPYLLNSIPGDIVPHMGCRAFRHRTPSARAYRGGQRLITLVLGFCLRIPLIKLLS
jgi:hypothetical protein